MSAEKTYTKHIEGWVASLREQEACQLANQLELDNGSKEAGLRRLQAVGLPVYPRLVMPLAEFLTQPTDILKSFAHPLYWVSLLPLNPALSKSTKLGLDREAVLPFVQQFKEIQDRYKMLLSEYEQNLYGGNIMANPDLTYMELVRGDHINLTQGTTEKVELYVVKKRKLDSSFAYSTENLRIREIMWRVLDYVKGLEGYFEFAITQSPQRSSLRVVFFDYKTTPSFVNLASQGIPL